MTKSSKEVETIDQLLADPWAVDIQDIGSKQPIIQILINASCL
ncbi:hypothetical protein [Latilactobacillus curvatus]|nr:hypothetical protein [Latilactobacillus curvatus]